MAEVARLVAPQQVAYVAPQIVAPSGVTFQLNTFLYNGQYRPGQFVSFASAQQGYNFLNNAPECVETNIQYPYFGGQVVQVYPSNGCFSPQPIPRPRPRPYCPCANDY